MTPLPIRFTWLTIGLFVCYATLTAGHSKHTDAPVTGLSSDIHKDSLTRESIYASTGKPGSQPDTLTLSLLAAGNTAKSSGLDLVVKMSREQVQQMTAAIRRSGVIQFQTLGKGVIPQTVSYRLTPIVVVH